MVLLSYVFQLNYSGDECTIRRYERPDRYKLSWRKSVYVVSRSQYQLDGTLSIKNEIGMLPPISIPVIKKNGPKNFSVSDRVRMLENEEANFGITKNSNKANYIIVK